MVALAGCASMNSVNWVNRGPGNSTVLSTDAYQRNVLMVADKDGKVRTCSEASPDAMAVFSTSLAAGGVFGASEREMNAALAMGQTAATIERTQTINMLREWMFRTCELWLSGALDKEEFLIRSARDHRSMIAILAVEQLTGVVKPPATIISGPAVNSAFNQGAETAKLLDAYRAERGAAETAETAAKTEASPDPARVTATKEAADLARDREKQVLAQLGALSAGLIAAVQGGQQNAGGVNGGVSRIPDAQLTKLAETVERIAGSMIYDETVVFCESYLFKPVTDLAGVVVDLCNKIFSERFENDEEARAGLTTFNADGTNISVGSFVAPAAGDIATPTLRAYLVAAGAPDAERRRRVALAADLAIRLGLIEDSSLITDLVYRGEASARAQLLGALRLSDQTPAGRAALAAEGE
jgi:hypothetical protein